MSTCCPRIHYKFDGNPQTIHPSGTPFAEVLTLTKDITPVCRCLLIMAQVQFGPQGPSFARLVLHVNGVALHQPTADATKLWKNLVPSCLPGHAVAVAQVAPAQAAVVSLLVQNGDPQSDLTVLHRSITIVEGDCAQFDIVPVT